MLKYLGPIFFNLVREPVIWFLAIILALWLFGFSHAQAINPANPDSTSITGAAYALRALGQNPFWAGSFVFAGTQSFKLAYLRGHPGALVAAWKWQALAALVSLAMSIVLYLLHAGAVIAVAGVPTLLGFLFFVVAAAIVAVWGRDAGKAILSWVGEGLAAAMGANIQPRPTDEQIAFYLQSNGYVVAKVPQGSMGGGAGTTGTTG